MKSSPCFMKVCQTMELNKVNMITFEDSSHCVSLSMMLNLSLSVNYVKYKCKLYPVCLLTVLHQLLQHQISQFNTGNHLMQLIFVCRFWRFLKFGSHIKYYENTIVQCVQDSYTSVYMCMDLSIWDIGFFNGIHHMINHSLPYLEFSRHFFFPFCNEGRSSITFKPCGPQSLCAAIHLLAHNII